MLVPLDADDPFVWVKVIILTLAGAVIPLTVPREHIPVDPNVRSSYHLHSPDGKVDCQRYRTSRSKFRCQTPGLI